MAKPNLEKLFNDIREGEPVELSRIYHAFFYHNKGWQLLTDEQQNVLSIYLAQHRAEEEDSLRENMPWAFSEDDDYAYR